MKIPDNKINDILNSWDGIKPAEARPFMYTRVMAKLQVDNGFVMKMASLFTRPIIAFCCVSVILIANIYTVFYSDYAKEESLAAAAASASASASTVTDVLQNENYILAVNNFNQ